MWQYRTTGKQLLLLFKQHIIYLENLVSTLQYSSCSTFFSCSIRSKRHRCCSRLRGRQHTASLGCQGSSVLAAADQRCSYRQRQQPSSFSDSLEMGLIVEWVSCCLTCSPDSSEQIADNIQEGSSQQPAQHTACTQQHAALQIVSMYAC